MSEDESSTIKMIETHEEFIQHIERGSAIIRGLSAITVIVALYLLASYVFQLLFPYYAGITTQTVNLVDPGLQGTEVLLIALTAVWLYIGVRDYLFTRRMAKSIKEARSLEKGIEKKVTG